MSDRRYRIGVDIGGTFADFAVFDEVSGTLDTLKVFSRPDAPGQEVIEGLAQLRERYGLDPRDVVHFTHGTTVGVNAVIMRKGPRLALFTTEGFEDVLELARLKIADPYNLLSRRPEPLVSRSDVYGIRQRMNAAGDVTVELDEEGLAEAVRTAIAVGAESLIVAFLHSYRNPAHEQRAREIIAGVAPGTSVSLSSEIWPILREYERTVTATVNAYIQPRMSQYLTALQEGLHESGVGVDLKITKSNGGIMTADQAKQDCVQVVLSGTASGVIGAAHIASICGIHDCLSLDVGGTSSDLALIVDGKPRFDMGERIGDFQIFIPSVAVASIGQGGGSIAYVDEHGVLCVGPESAGSLPGPVCYDRGGERPTITDAFVANGWVGHAALGYGAMNINRDKAVDALSRLAGQLGMGVNEVAQAIIDVSVSKMYAGASAVISRYGIDPEKFCLLGFGGAGPMLSCFLADALNIRHVLIPTTPGVLCAVGGLVSDMRNDFVRSVYCGLEAGSFDLVREAWRELQSAGEAWIAEAGVPAGDAYYLVSAEMRYAGQAYEIDTPLKREWFEARDLDAIAEAFHAEHARLFGHSDKDAKIQIVALKVQANGRQPRPHLKTIEKSTGAPKPVREVDVFISGAAGKVPLYQRSDLRAGDVFDGPAIVAQSDTTTAVPPGWRVSVDDIGNMHVRVREG